MHRCTDEEYSAFYPPDTISASKVYKLQENKELFCLHQKIIDLMLFGGWSLGSNYRALDIQLIPCSTSYVSYDGTVNEDDGSCVWGKDEAIEYLGAAVTSMIVTNQSVFQSNEFDEDRVVQNSRIFSVLSETERALWTGSFIKKHEFVDEIELF